MSKITSLEAAALKELSDRQNMALRIFRPLQHQEPAFEQPRPKYMMIGGANRGGKTVTAAALTSAIALGEKIIFLDGTQVEARMPWQKDKCLTIWLICFDQRHIGDVLYPALFKPGLFQVVYDPEIKSLRTYNPDKDTDLKPRGAPAFIPPRYVESTSWENQADKVFNRVTVKDPATGKTLANIHAFSSKGDPPAGRAVDFIFIDEALARPNYVGELQTRLLDRDGQLVWASWASEDSDDLTRFNAMIDDNIAKGNGVAKRVSLYMADNTMLGKKAIADLRAGLSEEEWLQRSQGILPGEKLRMYPFFDKAIHTAIIEGEEEDILSQTLRINDGIPPNSWTKTMVLDPGTSNPAVLFCAVPPPEYGNYMVPYQEIYPGRADPMQLAEAVAKEAVGQKFYRFIIDRRAGRQQTMGLAYDTRVVDAYSRAWERFGLECTLTKHSFLFASDDVGGRQSILLEWMHATKTPLPKLRIYTPRCPKLCEQLKNVKKRVVQKEVNDERKARGENDLVDCYDDKTEVLTDSGWLLFSDLTGREKLASMNMESLLTEFQKPSRIISKPYSGEMVRIKSRSVDLLVTPNHRMVMYDCDGRLCIRLAKELLRSDRILLADDGVAETNLDVAEREFSTEHYDGTVYCATVPNSTLIVRRNNKAVVCGNCLEYFAASHPNYVPVRPSVQDGSPGFQRYMKLFGKLTKRPTVTLGH